jgi:hypothetical protein
MLNSALGRRIVSKIFTALNQYCRPIDICSCCARASGDFRRVPASASDIRNPGRIPRHRGMGVAWSRMNVRFGSEADMSLVRVFVRLVPKPEILTASKCFRSSLDNELSSAALAPAGLHLESGGAIAAVSHLGETLHAQASPWEAFAQYKPGCAKTGHGPVRPTDVLCLAALQRGLDPILYVPDCH